VTLMGGFAQGAYSELTRSLPTEEAKRLAQVPAAPIRPSDVYPEGMQWLSWGRMEQTELVVAKFLVSIRPRVSARTLGAKRLRAP
jgi:hypothetical protein